MFAKGFFQIRRDKVMKGALKFRNKAIKPTNNNLHLWLYKASKEERPGLRRRSCHQSRMYGDIRDVRGGDVHELNGWGVIISEEAKYKFKSF